MNKLYKLAYVLNASRRGIIGLMGCRGLIYASVIEWLSIFDQYAVRRLGIEEADPLGNNYTRALGAMR
jgi:hypothetical protein